MAAVDRPPLDDVALRAALVPPWTRIDVIDRTDSTNADLLADRSAPAGTVLAAEFQTAGRGRRNRWWASPPRAGITVSALVQPPVPVARLGWLPLLTGVAVAQAVRDTTRVDASLKWPNDLVAPDGRKLGGILVQAAAGAAVVGLGLNVTTTAAELPVGTATSLALAGAIDGRGADRTALLVAMLTLFDEWHVRWVAADGDAQRCGLAAAYKSLSSTIGSRVRVSTDDGRVVDGDALDVDEFGRLIVRFAHGVDAVSAGDVRHLRSAP